VQTPNALDRKGIIAAILAYSAWGFFPLYWHLVKRVSALETMSHRVIWSLIFYAAVAAAQGRLNQFSSVFRNPQTRRKLSVAAVFIAFNWLLYVWAVTHGHVMETSLGYFIIPLINVAIGALVFKEHLSRLQKLSLFFAVIGVTWLTIDYGRPPWIALGLAVTFASYGYIKKTVPGDATILSMVETSVLLPFAISGAIAIRFSASASESTAKIGELTSSAPHWLEPVRAALSTSPASLTPLEWTLIIGGGAITGIPLLLFGVAAQRLPLSILGFFQYLSPSFQFLAAIFFFNEPLESSRLAGFASIWLALAIFLFHLKSVKINRTV
jgi:chloramphenicol-sensitive protein RarD